MIYGTHEPYQVQKDGTITPRPLFDEDYGRDIEVITYIDEDLDDLLIPINIEAVYYGKTLVWEYISANLTSSDPEFLQTTDGFLLSCKEN